MVGRANTESGSGLLRRIANWVDLAPNADVPLGLPVEVAVEQARGLRDRLDTVPLEELGLENQIDTADVLHAACRTLLAAAPESPANVLSEAESLYDALEQCTWQEDELGEREALLCSLAFISWRVARLLDLSRDAQRWESRYRSLFRGSLQRDAIGISASDKHPVGSDHLELVDCGSEHLFQTLLYLQDQADADPPTVARKAGDLYEGLQGTGSQLSQDLQTFFLGSFARLAATALKHSAEQSAAGKWLDLAEGHFRAGVGSEPELARVMFVRLARFYTLDRLDLVVHLAPALDATFARYGMEEDRVKGRILWSSSLKSAGRLEEAFEVLRPLREARSSLRRGLYGYVLRECGDLHLIRGDYELGLAELREAASVLKEENELVGLPAVVAMIGFGYRAQGMLQEAVKFFIDSQEGYARLGMRPYEAYTGLLVAETFLAMGRYKDAEVLVLSILPAIEAQGMVINAIAAVNLLREAIRRQRLDPQVLRELGERLVPGSK